MTKPGKADKWAARGERLSAALRENLKRRKEQARARAGTGAAGDDGAGQETAKQTTADSPLPKPKTGG